MTETPEVGAAGKALGCGCLTILALVAVIAVVGTTKDSGPNGIDAEIMCERFVKDRLKAPAAAKFTDETSVHTGASFRVTGAVDSQNSFGAMIRNRFACTVTPDGETWHLNSLTGLDR